MTNKRTTKRALLLSVLALVLAITMLMGTTYAWFTDSVSSVNNIIKSGSLDVELEYYNGSAWTPVGENTNVFSDELWEPGHTEVVYLKVSNLGSLALKYSLSVNIASEVPGTNVYGDSFNLSDYIYYGAIETPAANFFDTRDAALDAAGEGTQLSKKGYTKVNSMVPNAAEYVTLVVYMPETVDNRANAKVGTEAPKIELGINLYATQYTEETDSFDKYYDGGATWLGMAETEWYTANPNAKEFTIGSSEELAGLAELVNTGVDSFAGKTVKLISDLDLNNIEWTPIGNWDNAFEGIFDGQGHVIKNLSINAPKGEGVGLFGVVANTTLKGITLENVKVNAYSMVAALVGAAYPATISDCHITGEIEIVAEWAYVAGVAGYCYYGTQVDRCSTIAKNTGLIESKTRNAVGGITAWLLEGDHKVTNCQAKNLNLVGWTNIGGITGFVHYNNTIEGCSVENVTLTKTRVDGNPGIGLIAGGFSYHATNSIAIKNNTVTNATLNGTHVPYSAYNELYGSEYGGATTTNFVLENNTVSGITNNLVEVKVIKTAADLKAALTNGGDNYILTADIAVAKNETISIANGVSATIDLNGHKITSTADKTGNQELFLVKGDLTVKNGSMEYVASNNQGWNSMITIFDVTAGGVLNMEKITANVSGSDMNFIVHLNNWGAATLNVDDCDFTASYVAIRAFNSGYDMNTITVNNTAFHGGRVFWVHNYTAEGKDDTTLNVSIYGNGNTTDNANPVRYGFSDALYYTMTGALIKSAATQEELKSALTGNTRVDLSAGDYTLPAVSNGNVTINGNKDTVIAVNKPNYSGSNVTLNGVTVKGSGYATGIQHVNTVTYNDATIVGEMCLYGEKVVFNNCTFELSKGQYIWTYGAKEVEFNNCTFNTAGKAILVYNEGAGASNVTVKGCTFNATAGDKAGDIANQNCAAIEISNFQSSGTGAAHTVITEGNTYSDTFSGEWRIKKFVSGNAITVNGTAYTQIAVDGKLMTIDASKNVTVQ